MKRNKELKRMIIYMAGLLAAVLLISNLMTIRCFMNINRSYYAAIASLVGSVRERYPDADIAQWVGYLNQSAGYDEGVQLLVKYGIFEDEELSLEQRKQRNSLLLWQSALILTLGAGVGAVLLCYLRRRQDRLNKLTAYMRRVEQGNYVLEPVDNVEDELSALKNELYTMTVMLRESAELSRKQKKALADSVSDISHQLKTPITSCMVLLDNLSDSEHMEEDTRQRFLGEVTRQLTNVRWMVATLLKLSRLDAGVVEFVNREVSLDGLLEDVVGELEVLAEYCQVELVLEGQRGVLIVADARWFSQALSNIIKNAIEHSPAGGQVVVQVMDNTVYTAIAIRDDGDGMDEEERRHIFERFYRSRHAKEDSVGIGLSLAKEIIEHQGGYVTVASERGMGTEFVIRLIK